MSAIRQKYPGKETRLSLGFIFLRVVCPPIINHRESHHQPLKEIERKQLMYLSKIVQRAFLTPRSAVDEWTVQANETLTTYLHAMAAKTRLATKEATAQATASSAEDGVDAEHQKAVAPDQASTSSLNGGRDSKETQSPRAELKELEWGKDMEAVATYVDRLQKSDSQGGKHGLEKIFSRILPSPLSYKKNEMMLLGGIFLTVFSLFILRVLATQYYLSSTGGNH
uniref:Ras-GAP domain-containing protein n=1 Tax=Norrisiella sphaerica TaxID=552664 RepID=A0A7S2QT17_9EUKA